MKILQSEITGTQTSFYTKFGGKLSFILSFFFPERLHCSYLYNYYNYSPTLCIKCWDLIKFPYFGDTPERRDMGWKQAQRQSDFPDNSNVLGCSLLPTFWTPGVSRGQALLVKYSISLVWAKLIFLWCPYSWEAGLLKGALYTKVANAFGDLYGWSHLSWLHYLHNLKAHFYMVKLWFV